jgi:hypothetical protein
MSQILSTVAVIGIDIGKNSFHVVGLDGDGAIVASEVWKRALVASRLAVAPHSVNEKPNLASRAAKSFYAVRS